MTYQKPKSHVGRYMFLLISIIFLVASGVFFWPIIASKYGLEFTKKSNEVEMATQSSKKNEQRLLKATYKDLPYATVNTFQGERELKMNIFKPLKDTGEITPVLIYIHGGNWQTGDYNNGYRDPSLKEGESLNINVTDGSQNKTFKGLSKIIDRGVTFVTVDYRLVDEAIFPAQIHDVKSAVRFLRANSEKFGIDPNKIAVAGEDAGAQLALLLGMTGGVPDYEGDIGGNTEYSSNVLAVVDFQGPTDILNLGIDGNSRYISRKEAAEKHDGPNAPEAKLLGFNKPEEGISVLRGLKSKKKTKDPAYEKVKLAEMASPLYQVKSSNAPILIIHGVKNTTIPIRQSLKLTDSLLRYGVENIYISNSEGEYGYPGDYSIDMAQEWIYNKLVNGKER